MFDLASPSPAEVGPLLPPVPSSLRPLCSRTGRPGLARHRLQLAEQAQPDTAEKTVDAAGLPAPIGVQAIKLEKIDVIPGENRWMRRLFDASLTLPFKATARSHRSVAVRWSKATGNRALNVSRARCPPR